MFRKIYQFPAVLAVCMCASSVFADQAPNPRSAVSVNANSGRGSGAAKVSTRGDGSSESVVSRGNAVSARSTSANVTARSAAAKTTVARTGRTTAVKQANMVNRSASVSRSASTPARAGAMTKATLGRSAIPGMKNNARSATKNILNTGMARSANMARATAVFGDVSKIGGGYSQCRDSYATCMDQFCANANETFRRCYCSQKFTDFQETEAMFEEVKGLLQRFEDNNLNAVDKTAAEVNAMYTATVGEAAIKNDVSGAQSILSEIGDLLSGKKKAGQTKKEEPKKTSLDLGSLTSGMTFDMDDIWGGGGFDDMFSSNKRSSGPNMAEMSGQELYNVSNQQCLEIVGEACSSNAILNMATSSYSILITQDCNLYEKKLDAQRQAIMNTVREAEKMLRDARLEEYRAHNSADVNECLTKVRSAMLQETACGSNYKRCLDYSGQYVNQTTGDPIYSPLLFKLTEMINLYSSGADSFGDVLAKNTEFDKFLESKKMFVTTALDSCRDIADTVWTEFKRTAIIEIAQAQDEKIEEVKASCVSTMAECYDSQSGALKDFDTTSAQSAGAIAANAARAMCSDKVAACAALYSPNSNATCKFDTQGRITNATNCGLGALLDYVATVDSIKISEGCGEAMAKYAEETCAPSSSDTAHKYPWGCRLRKRDEVYKMLRDRADVYCDVSQTADNRLNQSMLDPNETVKTLGENISTEIGIMLSQECEKAGGLWVDAACELMHVSDNTIAKRVVSTEGENAGQLVDSETDTLTRNTSIPVCSMRNADTTLTQQNTRLEKFYKEIGATEHKDALDTYGACYENSLEVQCLAIAGENNEYATYDKDKLECKFKPLWYQEKCESIGGYYHDEVCYYADKTDDNQVTPE
ncbi:MAG: hypothetical protein R8M71_01585 [Alphaproteobacteria bacterium]|nr:hypothetical protein [Alphaproteobacteria bacterium]